MKSITLLLLAGLLLPLFLLGTANAQQCGPGCPGCSGKAVNDLLPPETILASVLSIPDAEEETTVLRLRYVLFSWLDAGIGYGLDEKQTTWSVRVQPVVQDRDGWRPAVVLGTGSVQTGRTDQAAYIQFEKALDIVDDRLEFGLAGGYATDLPDLDENWGLGTFSMKIYDKVSPFYSYDGINSHIGLAYAATPWLSLTGYYLEMEEPALSMSIQWSVR